MDVKKLDLSEKRALLDSVRKQAEAEQTSMLVRERERLERCVLATPVALLVLLESCQSAAHTVAVSLLSSSTVLMPCVRHCPSPRHTAWASHTRASRCATAT